jgi:hypothetical protein
VDEPGACCCGCDDIAGAALHRVMKALAADDIDGALRAGLLTDAACSRCSPACTAKLLDARVARRAALEARERFRARQARLARRQEDLLARRTAKPLAAQGSPAAAPAAPTLPPAAAAALERAKAKAARPGDR